MIRQDKSPMLLVQFITGISCEMVRKEICNDLWITTIQRKTCQDYDVKYKARANTVIKQNLVLFSLFCWEFVRLKYKYCSGLYIFQDVEARSYTGEFLIYLYSYANKRFSEYVGEIIGEKSHGQE